MYLYQYVIPVKAQNRHSKPTQISTTVSTSTRIDEDACGWFVATVVGDIIGKSDKKKTPTATHVVEYKQKETGLRGLAGKEAQTLTAEKYGPTEWWILLDVA